MRKLAVCCGVNWRRSSQFSKGIRDIGNNPCVTIACDNLVVVNHSAHKEYGFSEHVRTRHLWLQTARDEGRLDGRVGWTW